MPSSRHGYTINIPASMNPPAYHIPDALRHRLTEHRGDCPDCHFIVEEGHDCPDCECATSYWRYCDEYHELYDELREPVLNEDGRHIGVLEYEHALVNEAFSKAFGQVPLLKNPLDNNA